MTEENSPLLTRWFRNCGGFDPALNLDILREGIAAGMIDEQDEYGMTALALSVMSGWKAGVDELLKAKADTELRYFRTGETALHMAVHERNEAIVSALIAAGADPDAPNYCGLTPRAWTSLTGSTYFDQLPERKQPLPPPRIQNAEHLADHYHPEFKIPDRTERETLQVGQAVDLHVYGPKTVDKQDAVKVRITARTGKRPEVRYIGDVETPIERTYLPDDTAVVEFGPENIATIYWVGPPK